MKGTFIRVFALAVILYISIIMMGCGCSKPEPNKQIIVKNDTENNTEQTQEQKESEVSEELVTESTEQETEAEGGGNPNKSNSDRIVVKYDVLVNGSEYFYNNEPVSLDDLMEIIEETENDKIVFVSENNASQNAYGNLIKKLEENEIPYEEN